MAATAKDRASAMRPGEMDSDQAVLAAISSGSGQPRSRTDRRRYVLHDSHRQTLLLLFAGIALGCGISLVIGRFR